MIKPFDNVPPVIDREEEDLELLKLKDLRLLVKTGASIKDVELIPILVEGRRWHEVTFTIEMNDGSLEQAVMMTHRNDKQRWKSLDKVIDFIELEFPVDEVVIKISSKTV